jgi:NTP pyrophosphatase (non-canonical NTP hydrolase)
MNLERVIPEILKQNEEIHLFRDDDILSIAQMALCEAIELNKAVEEAFLTDDLTSVASEAADCLYVIVRLFNLLGIDEKAIEMKIKRNMLKYYGFDSKEQAISEWKLNGGDQRFFEEIDKFSD